MKFPPFAYERPTRLDEACEMLAVEGARALAGGQSLLPLMALRLARPATLVDLARVSELTGLGVDDGGNRRLDMGAMTTHAQIEADSSIRARFPVLAKIVSHIAHPAIRHRGTVGGSIAHADPAAEIPAACIALDAEVLISSVKGTRSEPVESLVAGPYQTTLRDGEIVTRVIFPLRAERRAGMDEVALRAGDFALAGAVCVLDRAGRDDQRGTVTFFGVEPRPRRAEIDLERVRTSADDRTYWVELASRLDEVIEDVHGDPSFRRHLAAVTARRAFASASTQHVGDFV